MVPQTGICKNKANSYRVILRKLQNLTFLAAGSNLYLPDHWVEVVTSLRVAGSECRREDGHKQRSHHVHCDELKVKISCHECNILVVPKEDTYQHKLFSSMIYVSTYTWFVYTCTKNESKYWKLILQKWCIDELSMFILSKWQFGTSFGAPDALMRLGARTFQLIIVVWSKKVWNEKKSARTEAHQHVRSTTHCHLDKTNMDKMSMHLYVLVQCM